MERESKQDWLMKCAFLVSEMSTCAKIQVGAVIAKGARIISTGYNGSAPGRQHCKNYFGELEVQGSTFLDLHHKWALKNEIHAEINAILFAAKEGIEIYGAEIYITHEPCIVCSKFIVQAGIKKVIYRHTYKGETDLSILRENNIEVIKV